MGSPPTLCVVYAAKSTDDIRGSLGTQLEDCRAALDREGDRLIVAELLDEGVSGFKRSRGAGLEDAMRITEGCAADGRGAELWVQHSDRLARGDGRSARHVVELALWALKANAVIRSVEDPDTFRDLLYAVVTGQRNHEDSRRKGTATAAGLRRAAGRGDYCGTCVDGYRVVVDADTRGRVTKRLEFDPARKPLIDMVFRLARAGDGNGVIARKVTQRGWRTLGDRAGTRPMPFSANRIRFILTSPRYAGLSPRKGEVVGQAKWPAYITPDEYYARQATLRTYHRHAPARLPMAFLLRHLAVCARCGSRMSAISGQPRKDGSRSRRYVCTSHSLAACATRPVDADLADHGVVAHLTRLLGYDDRRPGDPARDLRALLPVEPAAAALDGQPITASDRLRDSVRRAIVAGQTELADHLIAQLVEHRLRIQNAVGEARTAAHRPGRADKVPQLAILEDFVAWSMRQLVGEPVDITETVRLNKVLRHWFTAIELHAVCDRVELAPKYAAGTPHYDGDSISIDAAGWRVAKRAFSDARRSDPWTKQEIAIAMREWARENGTPPNSNDWDSATDGHPHSQTVFRRYRTWRQALRAAGLKPLPARNRYPRDNEQILEQMREYERRHQRPPRAADWDQATPDHPHSSTLYHRFGSWQQALDAAGLRGIREQERGRHSDADVVRALRAWARVHGRTPNSTDWRHAGIGHPHAVTVYRHFGTWRNGLIAAGLEPPDPRPRDTEGRFTSGGPDAITRS